MPTDVKTAVVQHALDTARLYLQNATLNRGVPDHPQRIKLADSPPEQPATPPPESSLAVNSLTLTAGAARQANVTLAAGQSESAAPAASADSTAGKWLQRAALAAALATGGLGAGAGLVSLLRPAAGRGGDTTNISVRPQGETSLLQYLEDRGYHVPPAKRVQP